MQKSVFSLADVLKLRCSAILVYLSALQMELLAA